MIQWARLIGAAALLIAGCYESRPVTVAPTDTHVESSGPVEVTFYLAGMNEKLQIL